MFVADHVFVQAFAVILVAEASQHLDRMVGAEHGDGGVVDTVEHGGLDGGVVYHVLEEDIFAHLQGVVEGPCAHEVAAQTAVAAKTVGTAAGRGLPHGRVPILR